jgi:histidinol dehydrogenase
MSKIFNIKDQKSMKRFNELQLQRSNNFDAVSNDVIEIISKIRDHGDDALVEYTNRFDKNKLILDDLLISKNIIDHLV